MKRPCSKIFSRDYFLGLEKFFALYFNGTENTIIILFIAAKDEEVKEERGMEGIPFSGLEAMLQVTKGSIDRVHWEQSKY